MPGSSSKAVPNSYRILESLHNYRLNEDTKQHALDTNKTDKYWWGIFVLVAHNLVGLALAPAHRTAWTQMRSITDHCHWRHGKPWFDHFIPQLWQHGREINNKNYSSTGEKSKKKNKNQKKSVPMAGLEPLTFRGQIWMFAVTVSGVWPLFLKLNNHIKPITSIREVVC